MLFKKNNTTGKNPYNFQDANDLLIYRKAMICQRLHLNQKDQLNFLIHNLGKGISLN